ncbi:MAG: helix-turn-helix transcriptional regulator [bacterium]
MSETPAEYNVGSPNPPPAPGPVSVPDDCQPKGLVDRESVRVAWERAMRRKGVRQADVCAKLDVASSTVSGWVSGARLPRVDHLVCAARFLDTSPADLLGWYGMAGGRVNGDCLRVALSYPPAMSDQKLQAMADLVNGMQDGGPDRYRRPLLLRVVAYVMDELGDIDDAAAMCGELAIPEAGVGCGPMPPPLPFHGPVQGVGGGVFQGPSAGAAGTVTTPKPSVAKARKKRQLFSVLRRMFG